MTRRAARRAIATAVAVAALGLGTATWQGCPTRPQRNEDFIPSGETARDALDASLRAWQRGETGQDVTGSSPPVAVIDDLRARGRTLRGYRILGPVPADAPVCFAVELSLGNPPAEVRERYVIVGQNPLWVWRYDDYLMITHWSHPMPDPKAAPKR